MSYEHSARIYDAIYSFKDYRSESEKIRELLPSASTLLDVACGTGEHLRYLTEWFDCEGLDLEPQFVVIAHQKTSVPVHQGSFLDFDLGRKFDAVTCLFSAIGYVADVAELHRAIRNMARHLNPGGRLIVEPWFTPEQYCVDGRIHSQVIDQPDLKIVRMNVSELVDGRSVMVMKHLVGMEGKVDTFEERHELSLFTDFEYREAFRAADLRVDLNVDGLAGRGLYIGESSAAVPT